MGLAKALAPLFRRTIKADVGNVIAVVGAAGLVFPIEHAQFAKVGFHHPVAVVDIISRRVGHAAGAGVIFLVRSGMVIAGGHRSKAADFLPGQLFIRDRLRPRAVRCVIQRHAAPEGVGSSV